MLNFLAAVSGNGAGGGGSFESIATVTPTSGTSVTFTSIPSTYRHLQIRGICRSTTNTTSFAIRLNGDSGTNYAAHWLYADNGTGVFASGSANRTNVWVQGYFPGSTFNSNIMGATIIDIHDYAVTTKNKTIRSFNGLSTNAATDNIVNLVSGVWMNTAAITSIEINFNGETIGSGTTFALYGIKGA